MSQPIVSILNLTEKIISDARICESGSLNLRQAGGNDAKLKIRLSKSSPFEVKRLVDFIRRGISAYRNLTCEEQEIMDKKTGGIIATIVALLLCGCPGLCLFLFGAIAATGQMPYTSDFPYSSDFGNPYSETVPSYLGFVGLCLALIFIAIPIVVGVLTLRNKPEKPAPFNEPLPPAS